DVPVFSVVQTQKNIVILKLHAYGIFHIESAQLAEPGMAGIECTRYSTVPLVKLVAMHRIKQEIGKIGKQFHPLVDNIDIGLGNGTPFGVLPGSGKTIASGPGEVTWVKCAETRYKPFIHSSFGSLVGSFSLACISHCGDVKVVFPFPHAVSQHSVPFPEVCFIAPRTVVVFIFKSAEQVSAPQLYGVGKELALEAVCSNRRTCDSLLQRIHITDIYRTYR